MGSTDTSTPTVPQQEAQILQLPANPGKKVQAALGAYIALVYQNSVLIIRRASETSIVPGQSGNWELPGGAVLEGDEGIFGGYGGVLNAALRSFRYKTGIDIVGLEGIPLAEKTLYSSLLPPGKQDGYDLALALPVKVTQDEFEKFSSSDSFAWADVSALNGLAQEFVLATDAEAQGLPSAKGLLSGWGGPMHCMALFALAKCVDDEEDADQAGETLDQIMSTW